MAKLAIKGHATRGKEVIKLLEMFGAKNGNCCRGNYPHRIYYINEYNLIEECDRMHHLEYAQYSLEELCGYSLEFDCLIAGNDNKNVESVKLGHTDVLFDIFSRYIYVPKDVVK